MKISDRVSFKYAEKHGESVKWRFAMGAILDTLPASNPRILTVKSDQKYGGQVFKIHVSQLCDQQQELEIF